eukprot:gene10826-14532_t
MKSNMGIASNRTGLAKENKTKPETKSVAAFLAEVEPAGRADEGRVLADLFTRASGEKPVMWGPSIIGFGTYHYRKARLLPKTGLRGRSSAACPARQAWHWERLPLHQQAKRH